MATRLAFSCTVRCFCFVQEKPSAKPKARRGQSLQGQAERAGRSRKTHTDHRQPRGKMSQNPEKFSPPAGASGGACGEHCAKIGVM